MMIKTPPRVHATRIGSKKIEFQHELRNQFKTLQELDDIDNMSETITYVKSRISSPTQALMTKPREMAENGDNKQRIEHAEICKAIKKKAREDIRKYIQETIRETIMA